MSKDLRDDSKAVVLRERCFKWKSFNLGLPSLAHLLELSPGFRSQALGLKGFLACGGGPGRRQAMPGRLGWREGPATRRSEEECGAFLPQCADLCQSGGRNRPEIKLL